MNNINDSIKQNIAFNKADQMAKMLCAQGVIKEQEYQEVFDLFRKVTDHEEALYLGLVQQYYRKRRNGQITGNIFNTLQSYVGTRIKEGKTKGASIAATMMNKARKYR